MQLNYSQKSFEYPEFDYKKIADKLCTPQTFQRILKEIKDTNDDFKTLRTVITETETVGVLHFVQYPADGALADKPIFGRIIITKYYPQEAPIVHIFTKTNRFNVDVYNSYSYDLKNLHSSVCFDIVNSGYGGSWKSDYTISALLASLLQAIVSYMVAQQHGPDVAEFVTMEKLADIHRNVDQTYEKYRKYVPQGRLLDKPKPCEVDTELFEWPSKSFDTKAKTESFLNTRPFILGSETYSVGIDLTELELNKSTVFSIVLTNDPNDLVGRKEGTVLFRNGVTGTAAKKEFNGKTNWFYHGIPLNQNGLKVIVTVTSGQFIISYLAEDGNYYIHGDYPVAYFDQKAHVGKKFQLCLYMKKKDPRSQGITISLFDPLKGLIQNNDAFEIV